MSLKKCKACNHDVSKNADKCPNCGEPLKPQTVGCGGTAVILLLVVVFAAIVTNNKESTSIEVPTPLPKITADCTTQNARIELFQKMVNDGYWEKIERPGTAFRVNVMPKFMTGATLDDKETFISVVSAYDLCLGGKGTVRIIDAMTGKDIGRFDEYGLRLD